MATEERKCGTCDGTGAVARDGGFDACPTCQVATDEEIAWVVKGTRESLARDKSDRRNRPLGDLVIVALADRLKAEQQRIVSEAIPKDLLAEVVREEVEQSPNAKCIQCGVVTLKTDVDHWKVCEKHPARAAVAELLDLLAGVNMAGFRDDFEEWDARRRALLAKHGRTP